MTILKQFSSASSCSALCWYVVSAPSRWWMVLTTPPVAPCFFSSSTSLVTCRHPSSPARCCSCGHKGQCKLQRHQGTLQCQQQSHLGKIIVSTTVNNILITGHYNVNNNILRNIAVLTTFRSRGSIMASVEKQSSSPSRKCLPSPPTQQQVKIQQPSPLSLPPFCVWKCLGRNKNV